jgi:hypothetical protein
MKQFAALAALALAACASTPEPASQTGQLLHYIRSNQDGSLPENIHVYRASDTRLEVGKMVRPCTNAAFVTADLDPERRTARQLVGGRIARDGSQDPFAWLTYEQASRRLHASVPSANIDQDVAVDGEPWIIYDFDLSELSALNLANAPVRADFRFAVALIWPEENATDLFRNLGFAEARFVSAERHGGRNALRYDVTGGLTGQLWLDAREGFVIEAVFDQPNHTEYDNFRLVLQSVEANGEAAWRAARTAHWANCPTE